MKIVVIGDSGLIGSKVVAKLTAQGHQAVVASPRSGVNIVTGEGLAEILEVPRLPSASRTPPPSRTPLYSYSSQRQRAISSQLKPLREYDITLRCRSLARSA